MDKDAHEKRIALTFDDGPRPDGPLMTGVERTSRLIATLEDANVEQAAFFVTTRNLTDASSRQRVTEYAAAGHVIANHSHAHRWARKTATGEYIADIDKAEELLSQFDNRRAWFRFPYLDEGREKEKRDTLRTALAVRGIMNGYVTVDTYDWHMDSLARQAIDAGRCVDLETAGAIYVDMFVDAAEHYHALAVDVIGRAPAQVLLLHENDFAAFFVGELVAGLEAAGWEIVTPDEAYADPIAADLPETVFSGMGRVAAFAYEAGAGGDKLDHAAADEELIAKRFTEARAFYDCEEGGLI